MNNSFCPGCNGIPKSMDENHVATCVGCGGIFTVHPIPRAASYHYVSPEASPKPPDPRNWRYFDLTHVEPDGTLSRRHGWYDPATKLTCQYG